MFLRYHYELYKHEPIHIVNHESIRQKDQISREIETRMWKRLISTEAMLEHLPMYF
jgi:hypothetical protein